MSEPVNMYGTPALSSAFSTRRIARVVGSRLQLAEELEALRGRQGTGAGFSLDAVDPLKAFDEEDGGGVSGLERLHEGSTGVYAATGQELGPNVTEVRIGDPLVAR